MTFTPKLRYYVSCIACVCIIVISAVLSLAPLVIAPAGEWAYTTLTNAPMCMFVPSNSRLPHWSYLDVAISYSFPWLCMALAVIGMMRVAWSSKCTKIYPVNLGTISSNIRHGEPKFIPKAWTEGNRNATASTKQLPIAYETTNYYSRNKESLYDAKMEGYSTAKNNGTIPFPNELTSDTDLESQTQQQPCVSTEFLRAGPLRWKITTTTSGVCPSSPFSISNHVTIGNTGSSNSTNRIVVSSVVQERKDISPQVCTRIERNDPITLRVKRPQRLMEMKNLKAFQTLAPAMLCFTILITPVILLHCNGTKRDNAQYSQQLLELFACMAIVISTIAYPMLIVAADRNFKDWMHRLMNKSMDDLELTYSEVD